MITLRPAGLALVVAAFGFPVSSPAQVDYRNLDAGRPLRTEDAIPVEQYGFELALSLQYQTSNHGRESLISPELTYGVVANGHIELAFPLSARRADGATDFGLAGPRLAGFYNFNAEGVVLPAISLQTELALPLGAAAGDELRTTVTAVATRSWGRSRTHLNAQISLGGGADAAAVHAAPDWAISLALDYSFIRQSLLLAAETTVERPAPGVPLGVTLGLGGRLQVTPTVVLGLGLARRLSRESAPDARLLLGISHAFAIRGLLPGGRAGARP